MNKLNSSQKLLAQVLCCVGFWATEVAWLNFVSAAHAAPAPYTLTGKVVRVSDGDTINVLVDNKQERIRLASIDAPETAHGSNQPGQPFGEASRKNLAQYVAGKTLTMTCFEKDRYERHICDVPVEKTTANRLQVEQGFAWANLQAKGKYLRDQSLPALEHSARQSKRGLWAEPGAVAPWDWRVQCWKNKKCV